ncbi:hypothetical protein G3R49_01160 [Shewanella sp. WXL01]|uniref:hypothetical protein n=1 Tax=Shewanella sp. WXL01 TaxID=2709721 RepID=UPI0014385E2B|nr:hypothetical protein [Shewanella sp. WXL01]NKF49185.1 hypothetical protein [Shewanella sp. WXL01]
MAALLIFFGIVLAISVNLLMGLIIICFGLILIHSSQKSKAQSRKNKQTKHNRYLKKQQRVPHVSKPPLDTLAQEQQQTEQSLKQLQAMIDNDAIHNIRR